MPSLFRLHTRNRGFSSIVIILVIVVVVIAGVAGYFIVSKSKSGNGSRQKSGGIIKEDAGGKKTETYTGEDGTVYYAGSDVKLPAGVKVNTPLYPNAKITMASVKNGVASVVQVSQDDPEKITSWYKTELSKLGWTFVMGSPDSVTFKKGAQAAALSVGNINAFSEGVEGNTIIFNPMEDSDIEVMTRDGSTNKDDFVRETKEMVEDIEEFTGEESNIEFGEEYE